MTLLEYRILRILGAADMIKRPLTVNQVMRIYLRLWHGRLSDYDTWDILMSIRLSRLAFPMTEFRSTQPWIQVWVIADRGHQALVREFVK